MVAADPFRIRCGGAPGATVRRTVSRHASALVALVLGIIDAALVWTVPHVGDWYQFWFAGHIVVTGGSPYDASAWRPALQQPVDLGSVVNIIRLNCEGPEPAACLWRYPPWTALVYAPFGALPFDVGVTLLHVCTIAAAVIAVVLLVRRYATPRSRPLALAIALAAQPLVLGTRTGHLGAVLLIGLYLLLSGLDGRRSAALVAGTILLSLKPHLFVVFGPAVVIRLVRRRQWRPLTISLVSIGVLALVTTVMYPPPLSTMVGDIEKRVAFDVPTLWGLRAVGGLGWTFVVLLALGAVASAVFAIRSSPRRDATFVATATALSLALAPYEQSYDHALLLPALLVTTGIAVALPVGPVRVVTLVVAVATAVAYPWWAYFEDIVTRSQSAGAFVPVLTLAVLAIAVAAARASDPMRLSRVAERTIAS